MIKIDKMDAFGMVVKALENNDDKTASEVMKIISKSLKKEKENNKFSEYIDIEDKKDERFFKRLLEKQKWATKCKLSESKEVSQIYTRHLFIFLQRMVSNSELSNYVDKYTFKPNTRFLKYISLIGNIFLAHY